MSNSPVLVVGGTGNVGVHLVSALVGGGHRVRVLARDPEKAAERLGSKIEVVSGDLSNPASLAMALRGVEIASLTTSPGPLLGAQEINFIEAARAAKVRRLVKLSGFGIEFANDQIHLAHAASEKALRASGIPFVVLRPVVYMSNLFFEQANIRTGKLPSLFGDGRVNFVDPQDVAEVTARVLFDESHEGATLEFGGPEGLSYDDLAAAFTRVLGRRIEHVRLDEATFSRGALESGLPDFVVESIVVTSDAAREGKYAIGDSPVLRVLGRRARSFAAWLQANRTAFA
jgi:uncharacterized protein YbjT (DUF2867 family)